MSVSIWMHRNKLQTYYDTIRHIAVRIKWHYIILLYNLLTFVGISNLNGQHGIIYWYLLLIFQTHFGLSASLLVNCEWNTIFGGMLWSDMSWDMTSKWTYLAIWHHNVMAKARVTKIPLRTGFGRGVKSGCEHLRRKHILTAITNVPFYYGIWF